MQKRNTRRLASMPVYFFLFAAGMSAYVSFITLWQYSLHYSKIAIGLTAAVSALVAVAAQPALSLAADRSRTKNTVLRLLLAAQALFAFLHMVSGPWPYVLIVMSAFTTFQSAALALSNAVILDNLKCEGKPEWFGFIRLCYSWGYAAAGLAAGFLASVRPSLAFALCGGVNLLALAVSFFMPDAPGFQNANGARMGLMSVLKYREFCILVAYSIVIHTTHSLAIAFLPLALQEKGAPAWAYGSGIFIMAAMETPFLLTSGRLISRFGIRALMLAPGLAFALRWMLTAISPGWWLMLAAYALQGLGSVVIYVGLARYVSDNLPKELSAAGQGVVNAAVISASRVIGSLIGGVLMAWNMTATFVIMGLACLAATAALAAYNGYCRRREKIDVV